MSGSQRQQIRPALSKLPGSLFADLPALTDHTDADRQLTAANHSRKSAIKLTGQQRVKQALLRRHGLL